MKLTIKRGYFPERTNGELWYQGHVIDYMIKLHWLDNLRNHSCIPEGNYQLARRHTEKRGWHLYVQNVPGRSGILIHPANDALKELRGCLAPVSWFTGHGRGSMSRYATDKLQKLVFYALDHRENVILRIKKNEPMNIVKRAKAPTPLFFKVMRIVGRAGSKIALALYAILRIYFP